MLLRPGQPSYPSLLMETRKKWQIPNQMRPELHPSVRDASIQIWANKPHSRLRSITGVYNCIGMVIACRRTWVDTEHLPRVFEEDGYRKLDSEAQAECGDIVVYRDGAGQVSHAAVVIGKNLYDPENPRDVLVVLSKWGHEGEYEHDVSEVPLLCGKPTEYWTDRKGR